MATAVRPVPMAATAVAASKASGTGYARAAATTASSA